MLRRVALLALAILSILAACKKEPEPQPAPQAAARPARPDTVGAAVGVYVKERVKVVSIDTLTRVVVLESEDGDVETITVSPEVKRLNAVRAGDVMLVEYLEAVALDVRKSGAGPAKMTERDTLIKLPGAKPTGIAGKIVTATVQVTAIDKQEQEVTVKTGDSRTSTLQVKVDDPDVLSGLKLGDKVDLTYVEALGISFEQ